jgi:16S rRNA (guanine966-N2)-methyltransferase
MRIIAGTKKGMNLLSPKTMDSRPILDRVKESLFSVLYNYGLPEGKIVADVFSGVGSMGLESLSRGAAFVTFIENDPKIIEILKKNIAKAGFTEQSKVIRANAFAVGAPVGFDQPKYDLILIDPPYPTTKTVGKDSSLERLLLILPQQMAAGAMVIVRTHKCTDLLDEYGKLKIIERRKWGNMAITILNCKNNDQ